MRKKVCISLVILTYVYHDTRFTECKHTNVISRFVSIIETTNTATEAKQNSVTEYVACS